MNDKVTIEIDSALLAQLVAAHTAASSVVSSLSTDRHFATKGRHELLDILWNTEAAAIESLYLLRQAGISQLPRLDGSSNDRGELQ